MKKFWKTIRHAGGVIWRTALGGSLILMLAGCSAFGSVSANNRAEEDAAQSSVEEADTAESSKEEEEAADSDDTGSSEASDGAADNRSESTSEEELFTDRDLDPSYDEAEAVTVTLDGTEATVSGASAGQVTVEDGKVTIQSEGVYVLSGDFEGQIYVDADDTAKVQLVLNGVSVSNDSSAAIYVMNANKVFVTAKDGTVNEMETGSSYDLAEGEDEPNAAIFSNDDLTLNGTGTITIETGYEDGIGCDDDLKICGVTLNITAADDGLRGKDSVRISSGTITITANGGHGIKSTNTEEEGKGYIYIEDGTFALSCAQDALHAVDITVDGGTYTIYAADDGMHADSTLTVNDGTIDIEESYEGLEGQNVVINGGDISIVSSDDGINAAGGSDTTASQDTTSSTSGNSTTETASTTTAGMPGGMQGGGMPNGGGGQAPSGGQTPGTDDTFTPGGGMGGGMGETDADASVEINGGTVVIWAGGDGLDSNGQLIMNGGTVYVSGPTNDGNGSIDYGTSAVISGGSIVAAGSSGMAETFGSDSQQASVLVYFTQTQSSGTEIALVDEDGNTVVSYAPQVDFAAAVMSGEGLETGGTYTLTADGETLCTITLSEVSTSISSDGSATSMGGGMGGFH